MLKTLAFILLLYLLIKFISNLFLPTDRKKKSTVRIIYQTFKNIQQQQQKQQQRRSGQNDKNRYFEEVEEAEFEDVTEEKSQS